MLASFLQALNEKLCQSFTKPARIYLFLFGLIRRKRIRPELDMSK